jgi:hypothetical protein
MLKNRATAPIVGSTGALKAVQGLGFERTAEEIA